MSCHQNFILFSYHPRFIHNHLVRLATKATVGSEAPSYRQNLYYYYMEICLIQFPPAQKKKRGISEYCACLDTRVAYCVFLTDMNTNQI
jgi:hypothetical protein